MSPNNTLNDSSEGRSLAYSSTEARKECKDVPPVFHCRSVVTQYLAASSRFCSSQFAPAA